MKIVVNFPASYNQRTAIADLTAAELEAFTKVMDKLQACNDYYGGEDGVKMHEKQALAWSAQVVSSSVKVTQFVAEPVEA